MLCIILKGFGSGQSCCLAAYRVVCRVMLAGLEVPGMTTGE